MEEPSKTYGNIYNSDDTVFSPFDDIKDFQKVDFLLGLNVVILIKCLGLTPVRSGFSGLIHSFICNRCMVIWQYGT